MKTKAIQHALMTVLTGAALAIPHAALAGPNGASPEPRYTPQSTAKSTSPRLKSTPVRKPSASQSQQIDQAIKGSAGAVRAAQAAKPC